MKKKTNRLRKTPVKQRLRSRTRDAHWGSRAPHSDKIRSNVKETYHLDEDKCKRCEVMMYIIS